MVFQLGFNKSFNSIWHRIVSSECNLREKTKLLHLGRLAGLNLNLDSRFRFSDLEVQSTCLHIFFMKHEKLTGWHYSCNLNSDGMLTPRLFERTL